MSEAPLHVQVIDLVASKVSKRREEHREKTGLGLPDQEYQRMVGRIRECTVILEELNELRRKGLGEIEDNEDNESDESTANRRQPRSRRAR